MKRLLFLSAPFRYYQGGAELQYQFLESVLKEKYDLHYLFRYPGAGDWKVVEEDGVTVHMYDYKNERAYHEYKYSDRGQVMALMNEINPDVIYKRGVTFITALGVRFARKKNRKNIIHIAHKRNVLPFEFRWNKWIAHEYFNKRLNAYALRNADVVIGQAQYQSDLMQKHYGRSCDIIVPNFHPLPKTESRKEKPVKIIWVANFKDWKHPEKFIELAKRAERQDSAEFIMIGRPNSQSWQQELEVEIAKISNLSYLGEMAIEEVETHLAAAHVFVNTSDFEGMPNTYIQSWMRKVPVVALKVDPDDVIKQQSIGFHSQTMDQMVIDVRKLIDDEVLQQEMGERAESFAREKYGMKNIDKIIDVIEQ